MLKYILAILLTASISYAEDIARVDEVLVCKEAESSDVVVCEVKTEYTSIPTAPKSSSDYIIKAAPAIVGILPVARVIVVELSKVMTVEMIKELILHAYKDQYPNKPAPMIRSLTLKSH